jgi:autotransporter-associated beta strand protein
MTFGLLVGICPAQSASFNVTSTDNTAKTLASGDTGTVTSSGTLSVNLGTTTVNITGNSTITNSGSILQTGTGRTIDNIGSGSDATITITNNASALIRSANGDTIRVNRAASNITLNNYGSIISLNPNAAGSQALDWNAITTGSNTVNNYLGGLIQASAADAVRPGISGIINNAGTISAIPVFDSSSGTASSSDGIDAQGNAGVQITNSGTISGRHGITGGEAVNNFTITITNNSGGTISGLNGAGINIDGAVTSASVVSFTTVINNGTITGSFDSANYPTGDGDGVDVDGRIDLTNNGIIRAFGSDGVSSMAEGVSVGGGIIVNNAGAEITGQNNSASGAEGHGILVDDSNGGNAFAATTITNSGLIRGFSGYGIKLIGTFDDTITNNATGTIRGAGTGAAIQTGAGNDTLINRGAIIGNNGTAIDLQDGNDALKIEGGTASIEGSISGGSGTNTLTFDPGTSHSFSSAGVISDFSSAEVKSGTVTLAGANTYAGDTTITAGTLIVANTAGSATGSGNVIVKNLASLAGNGRIGGNVTLESGAILAAGLSPGELKIDGNLSLTSGSRFVFELGPSSDLVTIGGTLAFSGGGTALFDISDAGLVAGGDYTLLSFLDQSGLTLAHLAFGTTPSNFSGTFSITNNAVTLHVATVPEPSTASLAVVAGLGLLVHRRRGGQFSRAIAAPR